MKLKLDAITPDIKNLKICLLFILKNLYNFKIPGFNLSRY